MQRYIRNMNALTKEENERLQDFRVCVVGCGGLGGYVVEMLGRIGIGHLTVVDSDGFEESNLNRQLYSDTVVLGKSKVEVARERMKLVNPLVEVHDLQVRLTEDNARDLIRGHDAVVDALDNRETRLVLQTAAEDLGIPMVHGAIAGWYGQVTTIFPGDRSLNLLYSRSSSSALEESLGNPSFTPALVAAIQASETIKVLIGRGELLRGRLLYIDLLGQQYVTLPLLTEA